MNTAMAIVSTIATIIGLATLTIAFLVVLLVTGVGFYMEDVHPVFLLPYVASSLCLLTGLVWPRPFARFAKDGRARWWVAKAFGIPAGLLLVLFYSLTTFHPGDLDAIVVLLLIAALLGLIVDLVRPSVFGRFSAGTGTRSGIAAVFGVTAVALLLVLLVVLPAFRSHRLAGLERADDRQRSTSSTVPVGHAISTHRLADARPHSPTDDDRVRVYPLHVGDTKVTYGQFYGGLRGWDGLAGYVRTLVNKDLITVPIYTYLIDHPQHGLMLVDAGINWEQAHDHDGYYSGILARLLTDRDEYILPPEQTLEQQVERLGYDLADIEAVFMTHVHDDHAGGLRLLPNARVFLGEADWKHGVLHGPSFETVADDLELVTYTSGPYRTFDASQNVFGDGSVRLLPTPGHSPGHTSVLVGMDGYHLLFVGDHMYTLRHLAVEEARQMTIGGAATRRQVEGIRRVQELREALPNMVILHAHDHTDYQFDHVERSLADGGLSADDRREIERYAADVFTDDWGLRPGNTPYYTPADEGERTGSVGFR